MAEGITLVENEGARDRLDETGFDLSSLVAGIIFVEDEEAKKEFDEEACGNKNKIDSCAYT